jgi:hypothetical protein
MNFTLTKPLNQNKMTKHKKVTWECLSCGNQHESYSNRRWDMQVCECGKSGFDLEEFYSRTMGEIRIIKEEELEK